eukprot:5789671-Pyramimonas_sp.AAC.2
MEANPGDPGAPATSAEDSAKSADGPRPAWRNVAVLGYPLAFAIFMQQVQAAAGSRDGRLGFTKGRHHCP